MAETCFTAAQVAEVVGGKVVGAASATVNGVESLQMAQPTHLSFLGNEKYESQVLPSKAAVVLVPESFTEPPPEGRAWIVCENPSAAFMAIVDAVTPPPPPQPEGIHPSAVVSPEATLAASAGVGANAVIEAGAVIGDNSVIGAGSYIGHETVIGSDCLIHPNVTVRERCKLGNKVIIHSGTTIGSDGFGYLPGPDGHKKIPQVGIVQIDDDVEIGAQVAVDRARFGKTWIKTGAKIDNLVQIAHNVIIGEYCFVIAQVGISGSTELGKGVVVAGQAGLSGHLKISPGVTIMAQAGVPKDLTESGQYYVGSPAVPRKEFARKEFAIKSVAKLKQTVKRLENELAALKK